LAWLTYPVPQFYIGLSFIELGHVLNIAEILLDGR